jgi:hypothetical protein
MENWGLVTYREARLLVDVNKTTSTAKRDVARVCCHEISHQFFGNSTTMLWWSDLWLNEGFARFCEYLAVDFLFPELDVFSSFVVDVVGTALRLDALKSTHAVRVEVQVGVFCYLSKVCCCCISFRKRNTCIYTKIGSFDSVHLTRFSAVDFVCYSSYLRFSR